MLRGGQSEAIRRIIKSWHSRTETILYRLFPRRNNESDMGNLELETKPAVLTPKAC